MNFKLWYLKQGPQYEIKFFLQKLNDCQIITVQTYTTWSMIIGIRIILAVYLEWNEEVTFPPNHSWRRDGYFRIKSSFTIKKQTWTELDLTGATELPKPAYFPPWLGGRFLNINRQINIWYGAFPQTYFLTSKYTQHPSLSSI